MTARFSPSLMLHRLSSALFLASLAMPAQAGPDLDFSTFLGGSEWDASYTIALGADGMLYLGGGTRSPGLATPGVVEEAGTGAFIAKIDPTVPSLVWYTYIGDGTPDGGPISVDTLTVDDLGRVSFAGHCRKELPLVEPFDDTFDSEEGFVGRLAADAASFDFLSYHGSVSGLHLDEDGSLLLVGTTHDAELVTMNPIQDELSGYSDAFITRIGADGSLVYSTYLGGDGGESIREIAVGPDGGLYVGVREYESAGFPIVDALYPEASGTDNAVLVKLSAAGELLWSTYYPGTQGVSGLLVDPGGELHASLSVADPAFFPVVDWFRATELTDRSGLLKITADGQTVRHAGTMGPGVGRMVMDDRGALITTLQGPAGSILPIDDGGLHTQGGFESDDTGLMRLTPSFDGVHWAFGIGGEELGPVSRDIGHFPPYPLAIAGDLVVQGDMLAVVGVSNLEHFPLVDPLQDESDGMETTLMVLSALSEGHPDEPSALDVRTWADPLILTKPVITTALDVVWEETQGQRYQIVVGDLDRLAATGTYDHRPVAPCDLSEPEAQVELPDGNVYYLVVSVGDDGSLSSLGRDSYGRSRPQPVEPCR
ncbi:MAG: hypothetical protein AAF533_03090 [Acidobacteriota bacterium]